MTVLLNRSYGAYVSGTVVSLPASTEAALINQNRATASSAAVTAGPVTSNESAGRVAVAAGASSVVVTNPMVNPQTKIVAQVAQGTADTTFTAVQRVVAGNGQFTIYGPANATAATSIDWQLVSSGLVANQ